MMFYNECSSCLKSYHYPGLTGSGMKYDARLPMILSCGHHICSSCVSARSECSKGWLCSFENCNGYTAFDKPESPMNGLPLGVLPVNVNAVGLFYTTLLARTTKRTHTESIPSSLFEPGSEHDAARGDESRCTNCRVVQAEVRCLTCQQGGPLCLDCFKLVHGQVHDHHMEPDITSQLLRPVQQLGCSQTEHSGAPAVRFCLTCARQLCSACCQGLHAGHSLCGFNRANQRLLQWLRDVSGALDGAAARLLESERALLEESARLESVACQQLREAVQQDFAPLHARLLSAESEALHHVRCSVQNHMTGQRERLLVRLRDHTSGLLPLVRSLQALLATAGRLGIQWCPREPLDYARIVRFLDGLTTEQTCFVPGTTDAGSVEAAACFQLRQVPGTEPLCYSVVCERNLRLMPLADLDALVRQTLTDPAFRIFQCGPNASGPSAASPSPSPSSAGSDDVAASEESLPGLPLQSPSELATGDAVVPTHFKSPGSFWVVRYAELELQRRLLEVCRQAARLQPHVQPADLRSGAWVLATGSTGANDWCRATVVACPQPGVCTLALTDSGGRLDRPLASLRALPPALAALTPLAHQVSLHGVVPRPSDLEDRPANSDGWSQAAFDIFAKYVAGRCDEGNVLIRVVAAQTHRTQADLLIRCVLQDCDLRFLSMRELLVFHNVACYAAPYNTQREALEVLIDVEAPRHFQKQASMRQGDCFFGSVSTYVSPQEFYVFRCNKGAEFDAFHSMQQSLQVFCNGDSQGEYSVRHPIVDLPVAARYSADGCWYRGVIEAHSAGSITVRFTDYANQETYNDANVIKYLAKQFYLPNSMCWRSSLFGIHNDATPRKMLVQAMLRSMLPQDRVLRFLCIDPPSAGPDGAVTVPVAAYCETSQTCLNVSLYDDGTCPMMLPADLVRLVKEAPFPVRSRLVRADPGTGGVSVQPRPRAAPRGARARALLAGAGDRRESATPTPTPSPLQTDSPGPASEAPNPGSASAQAAPDTEQREDCKLVEPWLAPLVVSGELCHYACDVLGAANPGLFYARRADSVGRAALADMERRLAAAARTRLPGPPLEADLPAGTLACVRLPNLLWYRCHVLRRQSDTCSVLLIDCGLEISVPTGTVFHLADRHLASQPQLAVPSRLYGVSPAGGQRWTRTAAEAMRDILAKRSHTAYMCGLVEAGESGLAVLDLVLYNDAGQLDRLGNLLRLKGLALKCAEEVAPIEAFRRLEAARQRELDDQRAEARRQRDAELAAASAPAASRPAQTGVTTSAATTAPPDVAETVDTAVASSTASDRQAQTEVSVSLQPGKAAPLSVIDDDDDYEDEFLLKPSNDSSDEDSGWVMGDTAAAAPTAAAMASAAVADAGAATKAAPPAQVMSGSHASSYQGLQGDAVRAGYDEAASHTARLLGVQPLGPDFSWPRVRVGPLSEPIRARCSSVDCSPNRMMLYFTDKSKTDLTAQVQAALQEIYSRVTFDIFNAVDYVYKWSPRSSVVFYEDRWRRGQVRLATVDRDVFHLLDVDTGRPHVAVLSQLRPVFASDGSALDPLTELINSTPPLALPARLCDMFPINPEDVNSHKFTDWVPYTKTVESLLEGCDDLRIYVVRQGYRDAHEPHLAVTVVLPSGRELGQALADGVPWVDRGNEPFSVAYRYDTINPDLQSPLLPALPDCYESLGLPKDPCEPCPVLAVEIADEPQIVSLQLQPHSPGFGRPSRWRQHVNEVYRSLVAGQMLQHLQELAPKQPELKNDLTLPTACVARYPNDGKWYRAELLCLRRADDEWRARVYFVDYGNACWLPYSNRQQQEELRQPLLLPLPSLAVRCTLQGLLRHPQCGKDEVPTAELCNRLIGLLGGRTLWLRVRRKYHDSRHPDVELFEDAELAVSTNRRLVDAGLLGPRRYYPTDEQYRCGLELD